MATSAARTPSARRTVLIPNRAPVATPSPELLRCRGPAAQPHAWDGAELDGRTLYGGTGRSGHRRHEQVPVDAVQVVALVATRAEVGEPRFGVGLGQALPPDNEPGHRAHHPGAV